MDTKLTLVIEESLIEKAKQYAKSQGRSLSDLVENYFKMITRKEEYQPSEFSPIVNELMGSYKTPKDFDYKEFIREEKAKKHL